MKETRRKLDLNGFTGETFGAFPESCGKDQFENVYKAHPSSTE
jgi:hypothetical protein